MKSSGVTANLEEFEKVFEDLDVGVAGMTGALDQITGSESVNSEVDLLIQEMSAGVAVNAG